VSWPSTLLVKFSEPTIGLAVANPNLPRRCSDPHRGSIHYRVIIGSNTELDYMDQPLITVDAALHALASANTPNELIALANKAAALEVYARRAKLGMVAQNRCAEIRLRAERKLGELLSTTPRLHGRPKSVPEENTLPSLSDLGVRDRKLSHRAQRLAAISQRDFDTWLRQAHKQQLEITTRLLLNICEQRQAAARNRKRIVGGRVDDLVAFARNHKMGSLLIDPPWPNGGWVLPYMTTTLDELQKLPIRDLAMPDRCHLHVWTQPNGNMFALKPIIEGWGFRLVSSLAWVKEHLNKGWHEENGDKNSSAGDGGGDCTLSWACSVVYLRVLTHCGQSTPRRSAADDGAP
jgi:hypothetical protein